MDFLNSLDYDSLKKEALIRIKIRVYKNQDIVVNGSPFKLDSFSKEILKIKSELPIEEQDKFYIELNVEDSTKMGYVSEFREELKRIDAFRVVYRMKEELINP